MTTVNLNGNAWVNSDNMGKRLLVKAGWSTGEGIGKDKQGTKTHIKVSIKNEKDGIGLKSEKRKSDISLMQCFTFDSLLKSKYAKYSENSTKKTEEIVERGLSRPKFGRAVSSDFFKPVKAEKWNEILCKGEVEKPIEDELTVEDPAENTDDTTKFNKSSQTVYEYFSMKIMEKTRKNSDGSSKMNNFILDKMSTLKSYLNEGKNTDENPDENEGHEKNDGDEKRDKKRKSKKLKVEFEAKTEMETADNSDEKKSRKLKRTNSEFDVSSVVEGSQNEVPKKKRKTREISPENREFAEKQKPANVNTELEIITNENEIPKKKKSKKAKEEMEIVEVVPIIEIADGETFKKKRKSKKRQSLIEEETEINVEKVEAPKKKKKSKKIKSSIEEEEKIKIVQEEIKDEVDVSQKKNKSKKEKRESPSDTKIESSPKRDIPIERTEEVQSLSKKNLKKAISTEIFEQDKICPWTTSNVGNIEGYKYY